MKIPPFAELFSPFPSVVRRPAAWELPVTLLRASVLEMAILAGHLVMYPAGIAKERLTPDLPPETATLPTEGRSRPPVLLLHGFVDNRSVFVLLRRSLARHGWRHLESLNFSPLTSDIRLAAEELSEHIEEVCARTGHREVDIVGHSLGGLIARYYVQRLGGDVRVRTLVTMGTPHAGTAAIPLASAHPVVRQMRPGSDLIEELREPAPGCRTRFVSFWSDLDQVMSPVEAARVEHPDLVAQNVGVTGIGHLALPVHPALAAGIRYVLEHDGTENLTEAELAAETAEWAGNGAKYSEDQADGAISVA